MTRAREAARLIGNNTFRLDSNNAVGFNSTTPDAMFDINRGLTVAGVSTFTGNVTMEGDLTVQGTTTTLDTTLQEVDLINVQANAAVPAIGVTQSGSGAIFAGYDGASEVFRITDSGSVGVGENSPMSLLHVKSGDSGASSVESGSFLTVESNGNSAIQMLSGTSNNNYIYFGDSGDTNIGAVQYSHGANALIFHANASERLRITSAGSVGVSTASPEAKLHLYNGISGAADADSGSILVIENSNHAIIQFKTPTDKKGGLFFGDAGSSNRGRFEYDHNSDAMVMNTSGATRLKLNTGGATITGICTATSFSGDGSDLTGLNVPAGFSELDAALFN